MKSFKIAGLKCVERNIIKLIYIDSSNYIIVILDA